MGRKPLPPHLKIVRGNPGKRPIKPAPALKIPPRGLPTPPDFLTPGALAGWHLHAADLYAVGILTDMSRAAFAAYCTSYARWQQIERLLAASPMTITTPRGSEIAHPLVATARRASADTVRIAAECGLTPASRARIVATPPEPDDDPAGYFFD